MIEALLPDTCFVGTSNLVVDMKRGGISAYDLVEYGCDRDRRVVLRRQHVDVHPRRGAVPAATLLTTVRGINNYLAAQPRCSCIRDAARDYVSARDLHESSTRLL